MSAAVSIDTTTITVPPKHTSVVRSLKPRGFKTMSALRKKNRAIGHVFFKLSTMRMWNSKIETGLLKGRFFVMSEQPRTAGAKRVFKVWEALPSGEVICWNQGKTYPDAKTAKRELRAVVRK